MFTEDVSGFEFHLTMFANLSQVNMSGQIFADAKFLQDSRRRPLRHFRSTSCINSHRVHFSLSACKISLYKEVARVSKARPGELIPSKDETERGGEGRRTRRS